MKLDGEFTLGQWHCLVAQTTPFDPYDEVVIRARRGQFVVVQRLHAELAEDIDEAALLALLDAQYAERNHYRIRIRKLRVIDALRIRVPLRRRWCWECRQCHFEDQVGYADELAAEVAAQNHVDEVHGDD